jgi:hypothetical protein
MKELDGWTIPNLDPTVEGDCAKSPDALKNAEARGWWTCGGWTRPTDITVCPNKMDWGVSFDDGPSPYSGLNHLCDILTTVADDMVSPKAPELPHREEAPRDFLRRRLSLLVQRSCSP